MWTPGLTLLKLVKAFNPWVGCAIANVVTILCPIKYFVFATISTFAPY